jgi:hypothetical protein
MLGGGVDEEMLNGSQIMSDIGDEELDYFEPVD